MATLLQVPGSPVELACLPHSDGSGSSELTRDCSPGEASSSGSAGYCSPRGGEDFQVKAQHL